MHVARENFIKAESSEKIRRALRHKVRSFSDNHYENGEKVFYKRVGYKGWRGPATVIGEEGKIVLIRHGTAYYRCHPCHLMKVMRRGVEGDDKVSPAANIPSKDVDVEQDTQNKDCDSEGADELVDEDTVVETEGTEVTNEPRSPDSTVGDVTGTVQEETVEVNSDDVDHDVSETVNRMSQQKSANVRPKRNTHIEYSIDGNNVHAKVFSVQPKRYGKHGNWLNIQVDGEETPSSVNWDDVTEWRETSEGEEQLVVLFTRGEELSQEVVDARRRRL